MPRKKASEITFQKHIADYLHLEHRYIALKQAEITDTEHVIVEDHLWAFLKATQKAALVSLYRIPLGQPPFLHLLRHRLVVTCLVRRLLRYYWAVRLPVPVHHCCTPLAFSMRTLLQS